MKCRSRSSSRVQSAGVASPGTVLVAMAVAVAAAGAKANQTCTRVPAPVPAQVAREGPIKIVLARASTGQSCFHHLGWPGSMHSSSVCQSWLTAKPWLGRFSATWRFVKLVLDEFT